MNLCICIIITFINNPKVKYDYLNSDKVLLKYMKHTAEVNYNIKNYMNLFLNQNFK